MIMTDSNHQDTVNQQTVKSYSQRGAHNYEDPMNKNFLYGDITVRFIEKIPIRERDQVVLDIGCGTGFIFDELAHVFHAKGLQGIGVEPAKGMLNYARDKYKGDDNFSFYEGSFENIPLPDKSVDHIVSTLALHWVNSLEIAANEMRRVLNDDGYLDILMIAKDDGAEFKKSIVAALKKHLTFKQIMGTATLVQRVREDQVHLAFSAFHEGFDIVVEEYRDVIYGTFEEHMKWWSARSTPVIAEVKDKEIFMEDLRCELDKTNTSQGIPFDTAYFHILVRSKANG